MKIYHADNTRSIRVIWLCEELQLPLDVKKIDFSPAYLASPEWRAKSPTGKVPVLEDGEIRFFESGAMMDYILHRYGAGALQPDASDFAAVALYRQWCWFAEATLARPLGDIAQHTFVRPPEQRLSAVVTDARQRSANFLTTFEEPLSKHDFLLQSGFSAADIMLGYSLHLADVVGIELQQWPNLWAYYERLRNRAGFKYAIAA